MVPKIKNNIASKNRIVSASKNKKKYSKIQSRADTFQTWNVLLQGVGN